VLSCPAGLLSCRQLLQQYILANAAVARAFSQYFAALISKPTSFFTFPYKDYTVDFLAGGLIIACCIMLMFTTAGGSWFNTVITVSQLLVILLVLILGFWKSNPANMTPFLPFGVTGWVVHHKQITPTNSAAHLWLALLHLCSVWQRQARFQDRMQACTINEQPRSPEAVFDIR
jgi:amino acid transporter